MGVSATDRWQGRTRQCCARAREPTRARVPRPRGHGLPRRTAMTRSTPRATQAPGRVQFRPPASDRTPQPPRPSLMRTALVGPREWGCVGLAGRSSECRTQRPVIRHGVAVCQCDISPLKRTSEQSFLRETMRRQTALRIAVSADEARARATMAMRRIYWSEVIE